MKLRVAAAILAVGMTPASLSAQSIGLVGANVDINHYQFTNKSKGARQALQGSFELGLGSSVATQLDVGYYKFDQVGGSGRSATLHGIYKFGYGGAVGGFWGTEDGGGIDRNFYGLEAAYDFSAVRLEGYFSRGRVQGANATLLGGKISSDVGNGPLSLNASVDFMDNKTGANMTRMAIGADYGLGSGVNLYGEVGTGNARVANFSNNDAFVGIGLRFDLGDRPGTTFGRRALLDRLPGL
ncbi:porin [Ruegeria pomeroyi]|uniref:porin n=1 Tax=Ruegeria pomeroyi TaxID=89184 RepID=UPI001F457A22|nr:porin [Ruegeria pomeroyi]MCE8510778.1 porin [Ruegeria pomeroyi]